MRLRLTCVDLVAENAFSTVNLRALRAFRPARLADKSKGSPDQQSKTITGTGQAAIASTYGTTRVKPTCLSDIVLGPMCLVSHVGDGRAMGFRQAQP